VITQCSVDNICPRRLHPHLPFIRHVPLEPLRSSRRGRWRFKSSGTSTLLSLPDHEDSSLLGRQPFSHCLILKMKALCSGEMLTVYQSMGCPSHNTSIFIHRSPANSYNRPLPRRTNIKTTYAILVSSIQSASPSNCSLPNLCTPTDLGDIYNHYISREYCYTKSKYFPEEVCSQTLVIETVQTPQKICGRGGSLSCNVESDHKIILYTPWVEVW
jgi:hypothetical protein